MKIRVGFVSNSSSSSFILPFKTGENEKVTVEFTIDDITEIINNSSDGNVDETITNEDEVKSYLLEKYGYKNQSFEEFVEEEGQYITDIYNSMMEHINQGKSIIVGYIDNNERFGQELIELMGGSIED